MANDPKKTVTSASKNTASLKTPREKRISENARFVVGETSLLIALRQGKSGFNVSAQMKTAGERAKSGSRSTHVSVEAAKAEFTKLAADAEGKGWKRKQSGGGSSNAFNEIPAPPAPKAEAAKV